MVIYKYIFIFSFIFSWGFSAQEDLQAPPTTHIHRNPSGEDSAYESNSNSGDEMLPLSPDLFADIAPAPAAPSLGEHPLLELKMEEDTIIEMVDTFSERAGGIDDEKRKTLGAIKELVQQKRSLIGLIKAYKKRNKGVSLGYLFDDFIDQVRKNENSYLETKEAILKELSKHTPITPPLAIIKEKTYQLEEKCRDTVVKLANHARQTSPYDPTYRSLRDRRKLISNNRLLGILQIL